MIEVTETATFSPTHCSYETVHEFEYAGKKHRRVFYVGPYHYNYEGWLQIYRDLLFYKYARELDIRPRGFGIESPFVLAGSLEYSI